MKLGPGILAKLVALGLLVSALMPLLFIALWLKIWSENQTEQIDLTLQKYDRFRSVAAFDVNSLGNKSSDLISPILLGSGPHAVLTSLLQSRLREIAAQRGVEVLQAAELEPKEAVPGMLKIGVRVEMAGPAQGLHGVLEQIEQSVPWLFLDNVQLRAGYSEQSQGEATMTLGTDVWGVVSSTAALP
jgi:Type II secretion system (T2SS), protein M subtype b